MNECDKGMVLPTNSYYINSILIPKLPVLEIHAIGHQPSHTEPPLINPKTGLRDETMLSRRLILHWKANGEIRTFDYWRDILAMYPKPDLSLISVTFGGIIDMDGICHKMCYSRDTQHSNIFQRLFKYKNEATPFQNLLNQIREFINSLQRRYEIPKKVLQHLKTSPMFSFNVNPVIFLNDELNAYISNKYFPFAIPITSFEEVLPIKYYKKTSRVSKEFSYDEVVL